jgi:cytochrome c oxidase subunit II
MASVQSRRAVTASTLGIVLLTAVSAGADGPPPTPSIFVPASTPAFQIRELAFFVLGITGAIFLVVAGLSAYGLIRFRRRGGDGGQEPPQVYGSRQIEMAWTVVPVLIVAVLFLITVRYIFAIEQRQPLADALEVTIIGHQYWWEIRYPKLGIVTANELHVPVSDPAHPTPIFIRLQSADVIHSFWIPQLAGKTDVIPNRTNRMWIEPLQPGTYVGQCAEYCGIQHAGMLLTATVHRREEFAQWVAAQQAPAPEEAQAARGRELFTSLACSSCHAVQGTSANGVFGPDLTHLMSRATLGAGVGRNTPENLRRWIEDPSALKPGALMPAMQLSGEDWDRLTAYLLTLR